jgi:transcriptional regulator GlxA family with amidase domain
MPSGKTQRIGLLLLPPFGLTSVVAAADALLAANEILERPAYEPLLLTPDGAAGNGAGHRLLAPPRPIAEAGALDGVLVVSDVMPRSSDPHAAAVGSLLAAVDAAGGPIGGIGTGSAWVARAGLLRGHRCTLHWAHVAQLAAQHPDTVVSSNVYEIDRQRLSGPGGAATFDLMIAWLGRLHGERLAQSLVAHFGLERLRSRDERQQAPSAARVAGSAKLVEAVALMEANVAEPLNTDDVARLVGVSRRQLERLFKQHLDALPSRWYLELRLDHARRLLQQSSSSILQIGLSCGFSSAPHFSNAYRNRYGRTPREERSARAAAWRENRPDAPAADPDEDPR